MKVRDSRIIQRQEDTTPRTVHIISRKKLKDAAGKHGDLEAALQTWYRVAKSATWQSIEDVRKTYPHADPVAGYTVFNIKGNEYRLIVKIEYRWQKIFIKHVLTHAEYDKGSGINECDRYRSSIRSASREDTAARDSNRGAE